MKTWADRARELAEELQGMAEAFDDRPQVRKGVMVAVSHMMEAAARWEAEHPLATCKTCQGTGYCRDASCHCLDCNGKGVIRRGIEGGGE
jgi:hypothetical protein